MSKVSTTILIVVISMFFIATTISNAKDNSQNEQQKQIENKSTASEDSNEVYGAQFPSHVGYIRTGKINASFNDQAQIGSGFFSSDYDFFPSPYNFSFETPPASHHEYLFGGGIWIGAIVDGDTLVSTSVDGWVGTREIMSVEPIVTRAFTHADYTLRAESYDTTLNDYIQDWDGSFHTPLNIKITNRVYTWQSDPLDNAIYYDYLIDYIGDKERLDSVYIGFYFDGDVHLPLDPDDFRGYLDDITGSIRDHGIAYIADNDGDPTGENFDENSLTKAFAFELLATSFTPTDTNFNWWISATPGSGDYGPRLKGTPEDPYRDFGTGSWGTPMGDENKYYIMRHNEWDFNQIRTGSIGLHDSSWMVPERSDFVDLFTYGTDTRFLFSIGPITLEKGKSERIIFATFTADSMHTDPNNLENVYYEPDLFNENLGLEKLIAVGAEIRQALDYILDPLAPPTGLKVYDDNSLTFDAWAFDDVSGHELYATPVDASTLPFPGLIPPWYMPSSPNHIGSNLDVVPDDAIEGLTVVNVAYQSALGIGQLSSSAFINIPKPVKIITKVRTLSSIPGTMSIEWLLPDDAIRPDHYKIYRYVDASAFYKNYRAPYYLENFSDDFTKDSIDVDGTWWYYQATLEAAYAIVPGSGLSYVDENYDKSEVYVIVGVDENGFESDYAITYTYAAPKRDTDILLITNSQRTAYTTHPDTIINFYKELLDGTDYSYDIFSVIDSTCSYPSLCPDWITMSRYKYIIFDDVEYSDVLYSKRYELGLYISVGGKLISFNALSPEGSRYFTKPNWYSHPTQYLEYMGIDSVFYAGHLYNFPLSIEEEKFGITTAISEDESFPNLHCDTMRYPLDPSWLLMAERPSNQPLSVATFAISENTQVTHRYKSYFPATSYFEGMPVGVKHIWSDLFSTYETYSYGFHLYYMNYADGRNLLRSIIDKTSSTTSCFSFNSDTENSFTIIIDSIFFDDKPISIGDEVGVYDGGICVGASIVTGDFPLTITTWEDNPNTSIIDGYTIGNPINFKIAFQDCELFKSCPNENGYTFGDGIFGTGSSAQVGLSNKNCCCKNIRGNVDGDLDDSINIADLIYLLKYLFYLEDELICPEEADINGSKRISFIDLVSLVSYMFLNGPQPADCP